MGGEIGQWKEWDYDNQLDWELLNFLFIPTPTNGRGFKSFV